MLILFAVLSCLSIGCGQETRNNTNTQPAANTQASTTAQPNKENKDTKEKESQKVSEEKKVMNGKPVTDDVLQSFRDSVTDDEMKMFLKIAKKYQYTESQVRDLAASMKMVGIDFSVLKEGYPIPDGFRFDIDSYKRTSSEGNYCYLYYECSVEVLYQKDDKSKTATIFIHQRDQQTPLYILYKDNSIVGDFSDMLLDPDAKEKIKTTVNDYVASHSGNNLEGNLSHFSIEVTKDAFSDESKWKGGNNKQFGYIIPRSYIRYDVPSEVYGEKGKQKYSLLLFNKHGELLLALDYPLPKKEELKSLIQHAMEKVKI